MGSPGELTQARGRVRSGAPMAKSKLSEYERKRDFGKTAEPAPRKGKTKGTAKSGRKAKPRFVVQEHSATRLHWDLRLEHESVGVSWAVPNGIPRDPAENRKAVHTEDHPLEYMTFEGTIPKGEYGGGSVLLWDRGTWQPEGDAERAYREGKIKFTLDGEKLHGAWTLVRMRTRDGFGAVRASVSDMHAFGY